jgi:hypothetical protein
MMPDNSSNITAGAGNEAVALEVKLQPNKNAILAEYFMRVVVVVLGVIIGAILAVILGFSTGWISIEC